MTSLLDDLTAITARHGNQPDDDLVCIPIGALRAAIIMLKRYDSFPLVDRLLHPNFIDQATTPRRGGRKKQGYVDMIRRRHHA